MTDPSTGPSVVHLNEPGVPSEIESPPPATGKVSSDRMPDLPQQSDPLNVAFDRHRERLRRMVEIRMDHRLRKRIDASDVLQEAFLEAHDRYAAYLEGPEMPLLLWLRLLVGQRLVTLHRRHLGTRMRDVAREAAPLERGPEASSIALAELFVAEITSPSGAVMRNEFKDRVQSALADMDEMDREALTLRHFEQLSRSEVALTLGISESAAGKRYLRALRRLKKALNANPSEPDNV